MSSRPLTLALLLLAVPASAEESIWYCGYGGELCPFNTLETNSHLTMRAPAFAADTTCRLWFADDLLQTSCDTSEQAARMFDYLRPMIDSYIAQERAKECGP